MEQAASIGIIGGADGPTVIFLTGPGWETVQSVILLLAAGLVLGLGMGILWRRLKKKK